MGQPTNPCELVKTLALNYAQEPIGPQAFVLSLDPTLFSLLSSKPVNRKASWENQTNECEDAGAPSCLKAHRFPEYFFLSSDHCRIASSHIFLHINNIARSFFLI